MPVSFRFVALPAERFSPYFAWSDNQLRDIGARRMLVDERPGFPCRVSLEDAGIGETVILLPFTHHETDSPYRASGPIFVREGAVTATPAVDEIPAMFAHRLLSLRGYDATGTMVAADVVSGTELGDALRRVFGDERVDAVHVHNARPGCYNCRVVRA